MPHSSSDLISITVLVCVSQVILDNLERLLDYTTFGNRFSNMILQVCAKAYVNVFLYNSMCCTLLPPLCCRLLLILGPACTSQKNATKRRPSSFCISHIIRIGVYGGKRAVLFLNFGLECVNAFVRSPAWLLRFTLS